MDTAKLAAKFDKALSETPVTKALLIGVFPTAEEVRAVKSKKQKRYDELKAQTTKFITDELRKLIMEAQENDCAGCTYKETMWFKYPAFTKDYTERGQFVEMLMDTLEPLGYKVHAETDSAQEPTANVVVTWKVQEPKPRR